MANVDYFLKIDGIEGESKDDKHGSEIEVLSFSFGANQLGTHEAGQGGGGGKVAMQDFHFVMKVNKASPKLFLACATGEHIKKAVLVCRKAGSTQQEYVTYTFSDLIVSNYQTGGSGGSDIIPTDQISLNFAKIEFEYKTQDEKGILGKPVKVGYDLKANKKL